ncbi:hypothetical protein [Psychroserpens sp. NJDZ02]|uniref:hypothetical protein n=1 Tax=Psychroserpens sp. NJDZ02 TaxID=2570561 RepID=UPI0010A8ACDD|nr:hypothetical protein [Psychroserpens sp. NJDZ02]QCE40950.1 hypothetical protein E9099_05800 [Psychroserpens sp. NJDZ02]
MIWKKLINYWCDEKGRYGLTIPFLVGAERIKREMTIESLLREIKESDSAFLISGCGDINEYVIGTYKTEYPFINSLNKIDSLILNDNELEKVKTIEELIEKMEIEYQDLIENEFYSKDYNSFEWINFNDNDLELINNFIE